jgi:uncharacterized protein (TIGR00106 family)
VILCDFAVTPVGQGESLSPYVARILHLVDHSGLPYRLHAMGTTVEGEWDDVLALVKRCHDELRRDCARVSVVARIDSREGPGGRLETKVASVVQRVGRPLATGR